MGTKKVTPGRKAVGRFHQERKPPTVRRRQTQVVYATACVQVTCLTKAGKPFETSLRLTRVTDRDLRRPALLRKFRKWAEKATVETTSGFPLRLADMLRFDSSMVFSITYRA